VALLRGEEGDRQNMVEAEKKLTSAQVSKARLATRDIILPIELAEKQQ
jgi:hypothetical protein